MSATFSAWEMQRHFNRVKSAKSHRNVLSGFWIVRRRAVCQPSREAAARQAATAVDPPRFSAGLQLFRRWGVLQGNHTIAMKTLLSFLSTLALITTIASLDSHRFDAGVLFPAFAVAALSAFALTEGRGPARPALSERFTRFPPAGPRFESPRRQSLKLAA
jgi:hypothetical protein